MTASSRIAGLLALALILLCLAGCQGRSRPAPESAILPEAASQSPVVYGGRVTALDAIVRRSS